MFMFQWLLAHALHTCIRCEIVFVSVGWFLPQSSKIFRGRKKKEVSFQFKRNIQGKQLRGLVWTNPSS